MSDSGISGTADRAARMGLVTLVAALLALSILTTGWGAGFAVAQDMGAPLYANRIVERASGPVLEPGDSGAFHLTLRNPNMAAPMENVTFRMSIYLYSSLEEQEDVAAMSRPPVFVNSGSTEYELPMFALAPNATASYDITLDTWSSTPHPGYFDQGAYFIRTWMNFDCLGVEYTLFSRGHFTDEQWDGYREQLNVSQTAASIYLENMSCDGIIPDTSFTVRLKIPLWPLALLVAATCATGGLALMYYLEENPGKAPRLEKAFQGARGKAKQAWALCKQSLRKP